MSIVRSSKTRLSAVLGALFILGLATMIYLLSSTLTARGYSLVGALQRSGQGGLAGGGPKDLDAIEVDAVLGALDTLSIDPGLTLQLASFSPTDFIDETSGPPRASFDLIVPPLSEVPAGLSDATFEANGNATFGPNGTPGLNLGGGGGGGGGGSPEGGGGDKVASDSTTASVPEPSVLILVGTGLVSVAGAPMVSRRWRSRRARRSSGG